MKRGPNKPNRKSIRLTKVTLKGGPWDGQRLARREKQGMTMLITVSQTGRYDLTTGEWHAES